MTKPVDLGKPIVGPSNVRSVNYFNGRLLTAEALRSDQAAESQRIALLGQAIGPGVVRGLWVTAGPKDGAGFVRSLNVTAGVAVNREGHAAVLAHEVSVHLVPETTAVSQEAGLFYQCELPQPPTPTNTGAYVLTVKPSSRPEGLAPLATGLPPGPGCGYDAIAAGVSFDALLVDAGLPANASTAIRNLVDQGTVPAQSVARNRLAHHCLGSADWTSAWAGPFDPGSTGFIDGGGALGVLEREKKLDPQSVPLALIYWTEQGVLFVDRWAMRRTPFRPKEELGWTYGSALQRWRAEIVMAQFQDQVADLVGDIHADPPLSSRPVTDFFERLPPLGLVPVRGSGSPEGFGLDEFFDAFSDRASGAPVVPVPVSANSVAALYDRSLAYPPGDLSESQILQLYQVRENLTQGAQRYVIFTTRAMHGFADRDGIAQVLEAARTVYRDFLAKRIVLGDSTVPAEQRYFFGLATRIDAVVDTAAVAAAEARGQALDLDGALSALRRMQVAQRTFWDLLPSTASSEKQTSRLGLVAALDPHLGDPGDLDDALDVDDFQSALDAQRAINDIIGSWSGAVAFGDFSVAWDSSPDGDTLVRGTRTEYIFQLVNTKDQPVRPTLLADIVGATTGTWGAAVEIEDAAGASISDIGLGIGASALIHVFVTAPSDAADEPVTLRVRAVIDPPTDETFTGTRPVAVGNVGGPPVDWALQTTRTAPPFLTPRMQFDFLTDHVRPTGDGRTLIVGVRVLFDCVGSLITDWGDDPTFGGPRVNLAGAAVDTSGGASREYQVDPVSLTAGASSVAWNVVLRPPSISGAECRVRVEVFATVTNPGQPDLDLLELVPVDDSQIEPLREVDAVTGVVRYVIQVP